MVKLLPSVDLGNQSSSTEKWYCTMMNKKQRKTFEAIFANPIRRNIIWDDVVSLIETLGGKVIQGNGSRVRFNLNGISLNIHSPHPQKELKRYQVKDVRTFLLRAGIER